MLPRTREPVLLRPRKTTNRRLLLGKNQQLASHDSLEAATRARASREIIGLRVRRRRPFYNISRIFSAFARAWSPDRETKLPLTVPADCWNYGTDISSHKKCDEVKPPPSSENPGGSLSIVMLTNPTNNNDGLNYRSRRSRAPDAAEFRRLRACAKRQTACAMI